MVATLKLRPLVDDFISCAVGNGKECSFRFDAWTPLGKLISYIGHEGPRTYGIPLHSSVNHVATQNGWNFRGVRSERMVDLLAHLTTITISDQKHRYKWKDGVCSMKADFRISHARKQMAATMNEVQWHKEVWFSGHMPKHAFILWLACLYRLSTRSRLQGWGVVEDSTCVLCEIYNETRDHLFLFCPYSQEVWRMGFRRLGSHYSGFGNWIGFERWLKLGFPNAEGKNTRLLMAQEIIYDLWKERNERIFKNKSQPSVALFKKVSSGVWNSCLARIEWPGFEDSLETWFRDA